MAKSKFKLILYTILILVLFFSLINILTGLSGKAFSLEFLGLMVLLVLSLLGFVGYAKSWGERVFFFLFLLYIVNLVLLWYFLGSLYVVLLIVTLLGFLLSVPKASEPEDEDGYFEPQVSDEPHSVVLEPENSQAEARMVEEKVAKVDAKVEKVETTKKVKHSPGKFVASKSSNNYHEPKCEWAKKIKKQNQVWFESKEDAWEKGCKAHLCVKD